MSNLTTDLKINHIDNTVIAAERPDCTSAYFFKGEQAYRDLIKAGAEIGDRIDYSLSTQKSSGAYHIDALRKWEQKKC
jgi:hypothetical protein